jgi:hypothetical protein
LALLDLIQQAAQANGLDPDVLSRIVRIESGNNPNARMGSYHGLLQLNQPEFQKYNPNGDIYDPAANLNAGAAKIRAEADQFRQQYGREPTPTDIYLTHQQGQGGYAQHMANPDLPAYQNMWNTGEGRQKGEGWARRAIWGNIPDQIKAQFPGGVDSVTSRDFVNIWRNKVEMGQGSPVMASAGTAGPGIAPAPQNAPAGLSVAPTSPQDNPYLAQSPAQPYFPQQATAQASQPSQPSQNPFLQLEEDAPMFPRRFDLSKLRVALQQRPYLGKA